MNVQFLRIGRARSIKGSMALRLDPDTAPAAPVGPSPADLREAPYRERRRAIETRLEAVATTPAKARAKLYAEVAETALAGLEGEPREPLLLNYAGVALSELGGSRAAAELLAAALRLDPQLPRTAANLERARSRKGPAPDLPAGVAARRRSLEATALRVAARARPDAGLRISLCMIVRDEEEMLPRCLDAVAAAVDEIVVVDTGSRDATVAIARSFGATVIEREWTGSFADARNVGIEAASGDWLLFLDADEILHPSDAPRLRELAGHTWREAFYLVETHHTGELGDGTAVTHNALRLFRNRPEYRFEGRVHEQIAQRLPSGLPERLEPTTIRVDHYGYLGAVRDAKEKSRRNIELLRGQLGEAGSDPFLHFNLGSEVAAAGDAAGACEQFELAWVLLAADPRRHQRPYFPSLVSRSTKALRFCGLHAEAEARAVEGLELFEDFTDLVFERALIAEAADDLDRAAALLEECLRRGDAPSALSPTVGCGSYLALVRLAKVEAARGAPAAGEAALRRCLAEHPAYLGSVLPLASAMLARGVDPGAVAAAVEEGVAEVTPSVRFMLATALYEAGQAAAAEPLFALVVDAHPDRGAARLALAETLLTQRRYGEAAEVAEAIAAEDVAAPAAARSELFALVLAGAPVDEAIARAARRGLAVAELDLFAAWAAAAAFPALDPAIIEPLTTMLEALLRVEEFEAFEALLPALTATGLAAGERRRLLARMYGRRGFLESAAEEWVAAVEEEGPDAEALNALAELAAARGLDEDARILRQTALEIASS
ncbi:MAG: hypothetical protein BGO11_06360 [Solirubrobacterales bacterium 70-9]|nr:MAG: hypothetical protein BGO11_06360 [Solirubrobacterales bacterium 70-9]